MSARDLQLLSNLINMHIIDLNTTIFKGVLMIFFSSKLGSIVAKLRKGSSVNVRLQMLTSFDRTPIYHINCAFTAIFMTPFQFGLHIIHRWPCSRTFFAHIFKNIIS